MAQRRSSPAAPRRTRRVPISPASTACGACPLWGPALLVPLHGIVGDHGNASIGGTERLHEANDPDHRTRRVTARPLDTEDAAPSSGSILHRFANPGRFLRLSASLLPFLIVPAVMLTVVGLGWGLFLAPADWQQGDAVRIMYVHVPSAWLASSGYFG